MLMAYEKPWGIPMPLLGTLFIYLASIFSLYSALEYSVNLVKKLKLQRQKKMTDKTEEHSLTSEDTENTKIEDTSEETIDAS